MSAGGYMKIKPISLVKILQDNNYSTYTSYIISMDDVVGVLSSLLLDKQESTW